MTLPASFPLSMSQIATELGRTLPLSLLDSWVIALAGKSGAPVSFSNLLGKTGRFDGVRTAAQTGSGGNIVYHVDTAAPFFGGSLSTLNENLFGTVTLTTTVAPNWTGNISVKNNSNGVSAVLAYQGGSPPSWSASSQGVVIPDASSAYSYTILPSN